MTLALLLPWFPILLAVGVSGRLLGRSRGLFLGVVCALFWVMLIQSSVGAEIWRDPWAVAAIIAGCVAISAMGRWSAETAQGVTLPAYGEVAANRQAGSAGPRPSGDGSGANPSLHHISYAVDQFDSWLARYRDNDDPWPKFGEFVRTTLYHCCKATHVRPYRMLSDAHQLVPLHEPDPLVDDGRISARRGIVGHVMTTGRSFIAPDQLPDADESCGELVTRLAEESAESVAWCFAIRQGTRRVGGVVVGHLDLAPERHGEFLRIMERLINQFWCQLIDVLESRTAVQVDPGSGLLERAAFLRVAEESIRESYSQGEPVACAVFALEGLRDINDSGRWEVADDLVREVADTLRCKIRTDDRIGRFDGSRIVLLLRRVDSELASLIVSQIMARLSARQADLQAGFAGFTGAGVTIRCGVAGSGTDQVELRELISRGLAQCRRARVENTSIASDLSPSDGQGDDGGCAENPFSAPDAVVKTGAKP